MDEREFLNSIITKSKTTPVLVDFWAPWCEPCKTLGPVLDRLAEKAAGTWELVKINVDEAQMLAAQFGIQGIPNVKLIYEGKLIGEFSGAKSEGEVAKWLEENLPEPPATEMDAIRDLMDAANYEKARILLGRKLMQDPKDEEARVLMAQCMLFDSTAEAVAMLDEFAESSKFYDKAIHLRTLANFILLDPEALPEDPVKKWYAEAVNHLKQAQFEPALDALFEVLIRSREYEDDGARKGFVSVFNFLGRNHPISKRYSRRFEMVVFS